jgi:hypothetical protein
MGAKETTENFWEVWNNYVWPEPKPASYRLYYKEDGSPDFYTMEDLPGTWIEVPQQIYILSPGNVRVSNGVLKFLPTTECFQKLRPSTEGTGTRCDPRDICMVVDNDCPGTHWKLEENEIY